MKLMAGGAGKTGAPAPAGAAGPAPGGAPVTSPMTTPQPNEGARQAAQVDVALALDLLEKALPHFGSETEEGKSLLSALSGLSRKFGQARSKAQGLIPAELKQLIQSQQASPELQAMQGGGGGGAPGAGAPAPQPMAA